MSLYTTLIQKLIPGIAGDLLHSVLGDLRNVAKAAAIDVLVPTLARVITKGIDGLVKTFVIHFDHADAERVTHGAISAFQEQVNQFCGTLRVYAQAAYNVEVAKAADSTQVDALRKTREGLRLDVQGEVHDVMAVLTGGTPDD